MARNNAFTDTFLFVNTNLVGVRKRASKAGATSNYALRESWGTTDRFRGVLGKYLASYKGSKGYSLVNYAAATIRNKYNQKQVANIPLVLTPLELTRGNLSPLAAKYRIELDNAAWNSLAFNSKSDNLLRHVIEEEGVYEGNPFWRMFLKDGTPANVGTGRLLGNNPYIAPVFGKSEFTDNTWLYHKPSSVPDIRKKSGIDVRVEPVYNYYADTTPPYEVISLDADEAMLTNFYCLESEMRNTGSTLNSEDYFNQLTLGGALQNMNTDNDPEPDPLFQQIEGQDGSFTESKTVQLYTLYSKGLATLKKDQQLDNLRGEFNAKYRNIAVLNSDLAALNNLVLRDDKTSGLRNLPFYNKLTIGYDSNDVVDTAKQFGGKSFLGSLMRHFNVQSGNRQGTSFIDILQLYIIQNMAAARSGESYTARITRRQSPSNAADVSMAVQTMTPPVYFNLDDFLNDIATGAPSISRVLERINTNTTTNDDYILIRNYNQDPLEATEDPLVGFQVLDEDGEINYPTRTFDEVLKNRSCYNELAMYRVDKVAFAPTSGGATDSGNIVQSFYLGRRFAGTAPITYIDSQIKYGVRYRYDVSQIRLVFGNKYSYEDLKLFMSAVGGYGRAVGNALGFYREPDKKLALDDYVNDYIDDYASTDKDLPYSRVPLGALLLPDSAPSWISRPKTKQTGNYIFKPPNADSDEYWTSHRVTQHGDLFINGTSWVEPGDDGADADILQRLEIKIVEGFGFDGNRSGGVVAKNMRLAAVAPTAPKKRAPVSMTTNKKKKTSRAATTTTTSRYAATPSPPTPSAAAAPSGPSSNIMSILFGNN